VVADGFDDQFEFCRTGWLGQGFGVRQRYDFKRQWLSFFLFDGPVDHDFQVTQALVGVGRGVAVQALEVFDQAVGDMANRVFAEEWFDLFHGGAEGFVISGRLVEFDVVEVAGDNVVDARVANDLRLSVLLDQI